MYLILIERLLCNIEVSDIVTCTYSLFLSGDNQSKMSWVCVCLSSVCFSVCQHIQSFHQPYACLYRHTTLLYPHFIDKEFEAEVDIVTC